MLNLLNQSCQHKSIPTLDKFGKVNGWSSIVKRKCRFVDVKKMTTDSKQRLMEIAAEVTIKEPIKLGDRFVYNTLEYEVVNVQAWVAATRVFGHKAQLILA